MQSSPNRDGAPEHPASLLPARLLYNARARWQGSDRTQEVKNERTITEREVFHVRSFVSTPGVKSCILRPLFAKSPHCHTREERSRPSVAHLGKGQREGCLASPKALELSVFIFPLLPV